MLRPQLFDLVFVDGMHTYMQVLRDLKNGTALVKEEGGILCGDDLELLWSQVDQDFARVYAEDDTVRDPATGVSDHPGVTVALADWFGEVSSWEGFWVMKRRGQGWEIISHPRLDGGHVEIPAHLR